MDRFWISLGLILGGLAPLLDFVFLADVSPAARDPHVAQGRLWSAGTLFFWLSHWWTCATHGLYFWADAFPTARDPHTAQGRVWRASLWHASVTLLVESLVI